MTVYTLFFSSAERDWKSFLESLATNAAIWSRAIFGSCESLTLPGNVTTVPRMASAKSAIPLPCANILQPSATLLRSMPLIVAWQRSWMASPVL